jgi:hypothetical protein
MTTDAERLDWFENMADKGFCPALVFDDNGHWAVTCDGMSPVPEDDKHTVPVGIVSEVKPRQWRDSPREAIDAAIADAAKE